jgi:hypothetical protein
MAQVLRAQTPTCNYEVLLRICDLLGLVAFPVNFNDPFEIGLVEVVESGKPALLIIANSIRKELSATSIPG